MDKCVCESEIDQMILWEWTGLVRSLYERGRIVKECSIALRVKLLLLSCKLTLRVLKSTHK